MPCNEYLVSIFILIVILRILRDKTMENKLIHFPNYKKNNSLDFWLWRIKNLNLPWKYCSMAWGTFSWGCPCLPSTFTASTSGWPASKSWLTTKECPFSKSGMPTFRFASSVMVKFEKLCWLVFVTSSVVQYLKN